jgi:hypothetical protein
MKLKLFGILAALAPFALVLAIAVGAAGAGVLTPASSMVCTPPSSGAGGHVDGLSSVQLGNARIIHSVSVQMGLQQRAAVIAIATAIQESDLHNLGHLGDANDHDSLGLFQQRPSQGWGTAEQIMNPVYASMRFFQKMVTIKDWEHLPLTVVAQMIQISAYPSAYAKHEPLATAIVGVLSEGVVCTPGQVSAMGWTKPVDGPVTSGFHTPERPDHHGVDISATKGTPIRAAAAGIVLRAVCNASLGGGPYSCDVDGSPAVAGCGWYVELLHADHTVTRYCHMLRQPYVQAGKPVPVGQVIGVVGSSGNSSGPHLHFETHSGSPAMPTNAMPPVDFMSQRGIYL